ncbi:hypothetical protein [Brotaphodocola sp.]|uniref:hypothetical protein n=1 Tax=Brotaphodocola sp. TaxID=3073577 RepID=UPI003D7D5D74
MSFWNTLGSMLSSLDEMNQGAVSDAARLSTDELCQKVNSVNVLVNPLIYTACSEELIRRTKKMSNDELMAYYDEYGVRERTDAKDILIEELKKRGLYSNE